MGQDLFSYLPSEMIINILSRLPARTTLRCKCVCKPWLNLLVTREFFNAYLSRLAPCLALFYEGNSKPYKIVEFLDELDLKCYEYRWKVVFSFHPPFYVPVHSSANGLLLLCEPCSRPSDLILCNPVTRDYIKLPSPTESYSKSQAAQETIGLKSIRQVDVSGLDCMKSYNSAAVYTPSFVPLKTFAMENVSSF